MAYEIETNVEMPSKAGRGTRYPWRQLNVNQGFFVEGRTKKLQVPVELKKKGWKFDQAETFKNGPGSPLGIRVKRVG